VGQLLEASRSQVTDRITQVQTELKAAENLCQGNACAYITGSVARSERRG
jgi:hypothetical protein